MAIVMPTIEAISTPAAMAPAPYVKLSFDRYQKKRGQTKMMGAAGGKIAVKSAVRRNVPAKAIDRASNAFCSPAIFPLRSATLILRSLTFWVSCFS